MQDLLVVVCKHAAFKVGPSSPAQRERERLKRVSIAGENVNQINKTLFSDCFTAVTFESTNKHAHTPTHLHTALRRYAATLDLV